MEMLHKDIPEKMIKAFYNAYNELGFGFLEEVYESALQVELEEMGLFCVRQKPIKVYYNKQIVGEYFADIIVNESVILELKAEEALAEEHEAQLLNYFKATEIEVRALLNFGKNLHSKENYLQMILKQLNPCNPV